MSAWTCKKRGLLPAGSGLGLQPRRALSANFLQACVPERLHRFPERAPASEMGALILEGVGEGRELFSEVRPGGWGLLGLVWVCRGSGRAVTEDGQVVLYSGAGVCVCQRESMSVEHIAHLRIAARGSRAREHRGLNGSRIREVRRRKCGQSARSHACKGRRQQGGISRVVLSAASGGSGCAHFVRS